jgi:nucleoside-diphosphate-sugar epimerase
VTTQAAPAAGAGDGRRTVAVLGGTGFVGRAFCARFAQRGWRVLAVSRTARPQAQAQDAEFRPLDLTRTGAAELTALLAEERVDAVVNAAGGMWGLTEEQMLAVNVVLVRTLVEAIGAAPGRPRLLQMGSVHEYGMVPIGTSIPEDHPPTPLTAYGQLKLEASRTILDAAQRGDVDAVVLRYGNVTGPGQPSHSLLGMIADKLAAASKAGTTAQLTLDPLTAQRDYIDLHDCADAAALVLESDASGMVVNVARGAATVTRELVDALIATSGVPTEIADSAAEAKPETEWQQLDVARAERLFGWTARRELKDSLAELWRAHPGK